jgi:hypothetical protein
MHIEALSMQTNRSLFFSLRCVLSLRQRKETNSNCLASFRVQQGATSISIWLLGKARMREREREGGRIRGQKKEEDKDISSPVVFSSEILLSFAVHRLKE